MFSGLMPALVTPFDERGELDLEATEAILERHIEAGVDGIVALGSTGEFSHLEGDERRYFAEKVAGILDGRIPLIVGVGTSGTREAISLSRHAESVRCGRGGRRLAVLLGGRRRSSFQALRDDLRKRLYTNHDLQLPMLTGLDLSPALVGRLAEECPNVVGIKDTVQVYMHTVNVIRKVKPVRPDFSVLVGFEDQILPSLIAGSDGAISGLSNIAPELFVNLVRAFEDGNLDQAVELHRRVLYLMAMYELSDPRARGYKTRHAEARCPHLVNRPRPGASCYTGGPLRHRSRPRRRRSDACLRVSRRTGKI